MGGRRLTAAIMLPLALLACGGSSSGSKGKPKIDAERFLRLSIAQKMLTDASEQLDAALGAFAAIFKKYDGPTQEIREASRAASRLQSVTIPTIDVKVVSEVPAVTTALSDIRQAIADALRWLDAYVEQMARHVPSSDREFAALISEQERVGNRLDASATSLLDAKREVEQRICEMETYLYESGLTKTPPDPFC